MKVALRKKKLARSRESLYLDIYHHGKDPMNSLNCILNLDKPGMKGMKSEELLKELDQEGRLNLVLKTWEK